MATYPVQYSIGDKVHFSGFSTVEFSVECEIVAICNATLAEQYIDIFLLLFNSDSNNDYYLNLMENNTPSYYYICKLLDGQTSNYADENGILVICDQIIHTDTTYLLEDELNINIAITYSTYLSGYTSKEALLEDINTFLSEKNLDYTITESYSDEELADRNLQDAMTIVNKLSEIEECTDIIDQLKTVNADEITTTYTNMISLLQNQIDVLLQKIESLS